jgi:ribonuclease P protein component
VLASAQRLRHRDEFLAAVRGGRRAGRGCLVVHLVTPDRAPARGEGGAPAPRAGFVVPRAVGSAVTRNRVRRQLRHLVRDRMSALPAGTTLVVRALPAAGATPYSQLGVDLDAALDAARRPRAPRTPGGSS